MKQCFGYVRVSTQKQGEGVSLGAQKEAITSFAERNDITITRWYEEQQTAAKKGRPQFNAMIQALQRRAADGVVMHKIDRSARNFFDWAKVGELSDAGIDVHFAVESLDFRSRGGRLAANVQMAVAEDYIRNLKDEVRKGQTAQLKQGLYPFMAPIGYLNNGKRELKTLDPLRAPLVRQAFELYASRQYSIRSLLTEMNRRGLRGYSGQPISKCCLDKLLVNPFYTGIIHIRRTGAVYQGAHEPLISARLFETVQEIRAGKYHKRVTRHNHVYRGLFACAQCGRSMIPEKQKGHVYYRCQVQTCPANCIREERLEEAVLGVLKQVRMTDEHVSWLSRQVETWWEKRQPRADMQAITLQLTEIRKRSDRLTDAFIDGHIDQDAFHERKQSLLLERSRLEEERCDAEKKSLEPDRIGLFLELVKNLADYYISGQPDEKREIVEITTSNRKVASKNVYLEPANWLIATQQLLAGFSCAQHSPTSRITPENINHCMEQLVEAVRSEQANRFGAKYPGEKRCETEGSGNLLLR